MKIAVIVPSTSTKTRVATPSSATRATGPRAIHLSNQ